MHVFTHLKKESKGKTGLGIYADGMVEHDGHVGQLLAKLKELGIEENTIVMYSTDNGAECMSWPDGGTTMFRGEKATNWEGGWRVPCMIRWPGVITPGTIINDIVAHEDMIPTLLAAAGDPTVKEDLRKGKKVGSMTYKVHLDGYNLMPALMGEGRWPRKEFLYWTDDGSVAALATATTRSPSSSKMLTACMFGSNLSSSARPAPLQSAHGSVRASGIRGDGLRRWYIKHMFAFAPAAAFVGEWLQSFREFPPRMKPGSFSLDRVMEKLTESHKGSN